MLSGFGQYVRPRRTPKNCNDWNKMSERGAKQIHSMERKLHRIEVYSDRLKASRDACFTAALTGWAVLASIVAALVLDAIF